MSDVLTAVPNVSTPCVTTNPCTCPVYGPGGSYMPIEVAPGQWYCALALEAPPAALAQPVPALSEWALIVLAAALVIVGVRSAS